MLFVFDQKYSFIFFLSKGLSVFISKYPGDKEWISIRVEWKWSMKYYAS